MSTNPTGRTSSSPVAHCGIFYGKDREEEVDPLVRLPMMPKPRGVALVINTFGKIPDDRPRALALARRQVAEFADMNVFVLGQPTQGVAEFAVQQVDDFGGSVPSAREGDEVAILRTRDRDQDRAVRDAGADLFPPRGIVVARLTEAGALLGQRLLDPFLLQARVDDQSRVDVRRDPVGAPDGQVGQALSGRTEIRGQLSQVLIVAVLDDPPTLGQLIEHQRPRTDDGVPRPLDLGRAAEAT